MVLRLKERNTIPKKVLIYGLDGTGKSTFAETYCKEHNLKAVCLDVDDTNFTSIPVVEFERSNHIKVKNQILRFIEDVKDSEFDTVIIDGVSSLLNLLVSDSKGIKMYGDRTVALNKIINELAKSKLNFILIGQIDLETERDDISTAIVNVNSIVNEKYYCYKEKGQYLSEVKKLRVQTDYDKLEAEAKPQQIEDVPADAGTGSVMNIFDNAEEIASSIIAELQDKTMLGAKIELAKLIKEGIVSEKECPRILAELERQL